jgi:hypothetical protein
MMSSCCLIGLLFPTGDWKLIALNGAVDGPRAALVDFLQATVLAWEMVNCVGAAHLLCGYRVTDSF